MDYYCPQCGHAMKRPAPRRRAKRGTGRVCLILKMIALGMGIALGFAMFARFAVAF